MILRQRSNNGIRTWQLSLLAVGTFTLGMDGFVLTGLLPQIAHDLSVSVALAGQLTTIFAVTYAIGSPVIATLTGRWDRRVLLGAGMVVFVLGMMGQALGTSFAIVAAGRVLAALGAAAFQANAYAIAGLLASPDRRGRSLAVVSAGSVLSMVLGVPFGVLVGQLWGWRGAMWTIIALAVVSAVVVVALPAAHAPITSMRARLGVLVTPRVLVVLLSTVLVVLPGYIVTSYLPAILGKEGTGVVLVAVLLAIGVGQVVGNRLVGSLVDSRGAVPVVLVGIGGVAVMLAVLIPSLHLLVATLAVALMFGFFFVFTITPQQNRVFEAAPVAPTVALGLNGSALYVGAALGAAIGGLVVLLVGAEWLLPVASIIAALATVLVWAIAPERRAVPGRVDVPADAL